VAIVSKRSRYALHGLGYLAKFSEGKPISFDEILVYLRAYSQHLSLSPGYIAKIFQDISRAGFTVAVSGPHGGYQLSRPPDEIPLIQVIEALDGPMMSDCCLLSVGQCTQEPTCGVRKLVCEAELIFYNFFEQQTVASLAEKMIFPPLPGKDPKARDEIVDIGE
jgi:Rrf2 family protein